MGAMNAVIKEKITLIDTMGLDELAERLKKIEFRGLYNERGHAALPYKYATFSLAKVYPSCILGESPTIKLADKEKHPLFSPQPTIYLNQLDIIETVDSFLKKNGMKVSKLTGAVQYNWEGRGNFHMLPPIVEKHTYDMKDGFIDFKKLLKKFGNLYVKDSKDNMHKISERYLESFYIDEVSSVREMDALHHNSHLLNYGSRFSGKVDFYIVCDGSHRIDYSTEKLNEPINVIVVKPGKYDLVPYYAFPVPFYPTIRLSSKQAEKMYPRLERDKIHLLNDFLKKTLHYDWTKAELNVSRLRSNI